VVVGRRVGQHSETKLTPKPAGEVWVWVWVPVTVRVVVVSGSSRGPPPHLSLAGCGAR